MNKTVSFVTDNFNKYDGLNIKKYIEIGGFSGLKKLIEKGPDFVISELKETGLRGRGGAAYPTWKKWDMGKKRIAKDKYILCNADEGEPGTFKDRELLDKDPYSVLEGMIIAGITIGSVKGYIYIREEYPNIQDKVAKCIENARNEGVLGESVLGTDYSFDIELYTGAGAYICGEGSALIESMEGKSGRPRNKPPRIGTKGFMQVPTMVNNVETFSYVTAILRYGSEEYANYGTSESKGTKLISLSGNIKNPGMYEVPFGVTFYDVIYTIGGGMKSDSPFKFLQLGGVSGPIMQKYILNTPITYENTSAYGLPIGSGAITVGDETNNVVEFLLGVQKFFVHESCGKCTPCREGNIQLKQLLLKLNDGTITEEEVIRIERISNTMKIASLCGLGQTAPTAILSVIRYFTNDVYKKVGFHVDFDGDLVKHYLENMKIDMSQIKLKYTEFEY
ncbi:complex I 51 kDa subunit family protein [Helicovermis profundi]|uniref:NADH-ubiquinone oxidoreductase 51kDa subunit iron-sulphur binding domain-containing protein n=1 Tax=Helicovermis profundi TaxID=3065157 RepID=A0AAU9E6P4_9FIRM|nr:hypothetical protein HLPR_21210 [Clostridia bacterium S502]